MRSYSTHTLAIDREAAFSHGPSEALALVELETYPPFVGEHADHLDMMAHLADQMKALTAVAWDAPGSTFNLRLVLTEDDQVVQRMARFPSDMIASGWVRSYGRLCLTSYDRLVDCAHDRALDLLHAGHEARSSRPRVLKVPPGTYWVLVLHDIPLQVARPRTVPNYTVLLRHYPFPPPRLLPVRLPALLPCAA
jgi:hypothetical protein